MVCVCVHVCVCVCVCVMLLMLFSDLCKDINRYTTFRLWEPLTLICQQNEIRLLSLVLNVYLSVLEIHADWCIFECLIWIFNHVITAITVFMSVISWGSFMLIPLSLLKPFSHLHLQCAFPVCSLGEGISSPLTSTQAQCMGVFGWRSRERPLSARQHPDWWWLPLHVRTCWCNDLNHRLSAGGEQNTTCSDSMEQQRNKNTSHTEAAESKQKRFWSVFTNIYKLQNDLSLIISWQSTSELRCQV